MKRIFYIAAVTSVLAGCAGSANHDVLTSHQANDSTLSCRQINDEMVRTQVVIDGVNKDKEDLSGADVVDGLLWFPFNLIAKNNNYSSALEAADKRMQRLSDLQKDRNCGTSLAQNSDDYQQLSKKLDELNVLYKKGSITAEEYSAAKRKALGLASN